MDDISGCFHAVERVGRSELNNRIDERLEHAAVSVMGGHQKKNRADMSSEWMVLGGDDWYEASAKTMVIMHVTLFHHENHLQPLMHAVILHKSMIIV